IQNLVLMSPPRFFPLQRVWQLSRKPAAGSIPPVFRLCHMHLPRELIDGQGLGSRRRLSEFLPTGTVRYEPIRSPPAPVHAFPHLSRGRERPSWRLGGGSRTGSAANRTSRRTTDRRYTLGPSCPR